MSQKPPNIFFPFLKRKKCIFSFFKEIGEDNKNIIQINMLNRKNHNVGEGMEIKMNFPHVLSQKLMHFPKPNESQGNPAHSHDEIFLLTSVLWT